MLNNFCRFGFPTDTVIMSKFFPTFLKNVISDSQSFICLSVFSKWLKEWHCSNYIKYISEGDKDEKLSPGDYVNIIRPDLRNLTNQ